jgi:hypothetical protein
MAVSVMCLAVGCRSLIAAGGLEQEHPKIGDGVSLSFEDDGIVVPPDLNFVAVKYVLTAMIT